MPGADPIVLNNWIRASYIHCKSRRVHSKHDFLVEQSRSQPLHALDACLAYDAEIAQTSNLEVCQFRLVRPCVDIRGGDARSATGSAVSLWM
jgi:hypothetical protein